MRTRPRFFGTLCSLKNWHGRPKKASLLGLLAKISVLDLREKSPASQRRSFREYKRIVWSLWLWFVFGRFWSFFGRLFGVLVVFVRPCSCWSSLVVLGRLWSSLVVFGRPWSWSLVVVSLVRPMAAIPFAAQALVGTLPDAVVATLSTNPVTLKELVDEFVRQLPEAAQMISNVMQSSATSFLVHCSSTRHAEVVLHAGLTFRTYPLTFVPAPNAQWVKLTRVVFGTTENAIKSRLSEYGTVLKIRRELVQGIGISVYSVKIELRKPIPSRISIAHYPVNVFYRGQVQQCFRCEQTGHLSRDCPFKRSGVHNAPRIIGPTTVIPAADTSVPAGSAPPGTKVPVGDVVSPVLDVDPPVNTGVVDSSASNAAAMDVTGENVSLPPSTSSTSSDSSVSTTVNPDTGKRQLSTDIGPSSKKEKSESPVLLYEKYEKELLRENLLGAAATPEDKKAVQLIRDRIPKDLLARFTVTVTFRHPTLAPPGARIGRLLTAFRSLEWPPYLLDLSTSVLLQPILPPDTPPTDVPYVRYELFRLYQECLKKMPDLADVPADVTAEMETLPSDTRTAFETFFVSTHPEFLEGVDAEVRDAIVGAYISRTPIHYVN